KATAAISGYTDELFDEIRGMKKHVDRYEDKLGTYLVQLSEQNMTTEDNYEVSKMLHVINDFERISDYSVNVAVAAREMVEKGITFSKEAMKEIEILKTATIELTDLTGNSFKNNNINLAMKAEPLQNVINELIKEIKSNHIYRLKNKECTIELGFVLSDVLNAYERGAAHCSNIAIAIMEASKESYAPHESSRSYRKDKHSEYQEFYSEYRKKYKITNI
ncbi:MAG: Na/Pi cotransporter family protein, partial [Oscillospiraceae bacterium]|nr:Na/Pi cotransporter family protein [Oscillospiraceae bacterium]